MTPFRTLIRSLSFREDRSAEFQRIPSQEWPRLLEICDRTQMTLSIGIRHREVLPDSVRDRIDKNIKSNMVRHDVLFDEYRLIASALQEHSIGFVVLKGFTQIAPLYVPDQCYRPQYDIDLYCPPEFLKPARNALLRSGLVPVQTFSKHADHLPPMIRNKNWKWRGDYFDFELPLTVEVHFRFWHAQRERITVLSTAGFWQRRIRRNIRGLDVPMLDLADSISYSALHLMRHLLRGDVRTYHVYEVAHFLHHTRQDHALWHEWLDRHPGTVSNIESAAFRLARDWFDCDVHPVVAEAIESLPPKVQRWFDLFGNSALALERPNKDELFLHLSFVPDVRSRCVIIAQRMLPFRASCVVDGESRSSWPHAISAVLRQISFVLNRASHHVRTIGPFFWSFVRWTMAGRKYAA
jgi:hypothetical protein